MNGLATFGKTSLRCLGPVLVRSRSGLGVDLGYLGAVSGPRGAQLVLLGAVFRLLFSGVGSLGVVWEPSWSRPEASSAVLCPFRAASGLSDRTLGVSCGDLGVLS